MEAAGARRDVRTMSWIRSNVSDKVVGTQGEQSLQLKSSQKKEGARVCVCKFQSKKNKSNDFSRQDHNRPLRPDLSPTSIGCPIGQWHFCC